MNFRREFMATTYGTDWVITGFMLRNGNFHPLGTDSKTISNGFESLCGPYIKTIAEKYGYKVIKGKQTQYPDYSLVHRDSDNKIALDVKTTHITKSGKICFTLGTFKLPEIDGKKNPRLVFPYEEYSQHLVIGFTYVRTPNGPHSYDHVQWFVQDKWKITSTGVRSGNTKNIGSIASKNIQDFISGNGVFKSEDECFQFWLKKTLGG